MSACWIDMGVLVRTYPHVRGLIDIYSNVQKPVLIFFFVFLEYGKKTGTRMGRRREKKMEVLLYRVNILTKYSIYI